MGRALATTTGLTGGPYAQLLSLQPEVQLTLNNVELLDDHIGRHPTKHHPQNIVAKSSAIPFCRTCLPNPQMQ